MDNKSAINAAIKFLNENLNLFAYEELRDNSSSITTTFSYRTKTGETRNGRLNVGSSVTYSTKKRYVVVEFYGSKKYRANAVDCLVRKQITSGLKFDKKTKDRLDSVLSFIEYTFEQELVITERENNTKNFKETMMRELNQIGVNITYGSHFEKLNDISTEIEIKDRTVKFSATTNDIELLRKLREVCESHTLSN
ncbi:hypothetical protein OTK49_20680 [Vibrio coralliirubri]|uniref:hypothetical protein n=1 Tax=Vibrio coralliirubri TaxID=1516159 RepID=UPI002283ACBD|nr:hypothetical protein [Vibrio coralliirubri]MCY9864934.1 hypothetical protein [Vibrio coralliirubri]